MSLRSLTILMFLIVTCFLLGCDKENNADPNEGELITTVRLSLMEQGSTVPQVFEFRDIDGPGGQAPSQFDSIILNPNKQFQASIEFLNESEVPAEDITLEVSAEADDHQVYYEPSISSLTVNNLNTDANGLPLGIQSNWNTGSAAKGTIKISLKHKPGEKAAGDPVSKGETDIELQFGLRIK